MRFGILSSVCNSHSGARAPIELGISLAKRGHSVALFVIDKDKDDTTFQYLIQHGIEIIFLPYPTFPFGNIRVIFRIARLIKEKRLEILTSHTIPTYHLGGVLSGRPIIMTYHGSQFDAIYERILPYETPSLKLHFFNFLANVYIYVRMALMIWTSKKIVSISTYTQKELLRLYFRMSSIIHWSATPHYFQDLLPSSTFYKKQKGEVLLLSISRITPYKGFHTIIDTFQRIAPKNATLLIVGSLPVQPYLAFLRKRMGKKVKIFLDPSDTELVSLYQTCDLYVTCDRYLFFGMPVLEAAAFGIPAIAMDYAAAREMVRDKKTGYIVRSEKELAEKMFELIKHAKKRKAFGEHAKVFAQTRFGWFPMIQKYERLFRKYAKNSPATTKERQE
ncbi:MAG TPA: glycosyltransferase family 4 protein [Patescibacteria group bacterium]|nr:glycosyltransferase family 4 protein [Patescibacteria group bacterium]